MLTRQEVLDKASAHLLAQGSRSMDFHGGTCMYRGEDGKMCGVGPFIKDEFYSEALEGEGVCSDIVMKALLKSGVIDQIPNQEAKYTHPTLSFLRDIQDVHDGQEPENWERCLRNLATKHNLIFGTEVTND